MARVTIVLEVLLQHFHPMEWWPLGAVQGLTSLLNGRSQLGVSSNWTSQSNICLSDPMMRFHHEVRGILVYGSFRAANRWPSTCVKSNHLRDYSSDPKVRYALIGIFGEINETHLIRPLHHLISTQPRAEIIMFMEVPPLGLSIQWPINSHWGAGV